MELKAWISAMRLRTLPLTVACISLAGFLAASHGYFSLSVFLLSLCTAVFLQILSNLANDYGDSIHGADSEFREGPKREVQSGNISRKSMFTAMVLFAIMSLLSGITLLFISGINTTEFIVFLLFGLCSIIAAVLYTNGKLPYGYIGLGDISVLIFFGLIGVAASYYLHARIFNAMILLPAMSCGLMSVAVLNVNNIRDIESDLKAGKRSLAARLGRRGAVNYHAIILIIAMLSSLIYVILNYESAVQFLFLLVTPLLFRNVQAVRSKMNALELDPYLKQMAISTLLYVLIFGITHL